MGFPLFQPSVSKNTSYYLESGHWFISLYNDDGESKPVRFVATVSEDMTRNCPRGCSGRGDCVLGRCQCRTGFDGPDIFGNEPARQRKKNRQMLEPVEFIDRI